MKKRHNFKQLDTASQFKSMKLMSLISLLILVTFSSVLYIGVILSRNHIYVERIMEQYRIRIEECAEETIQFTQTLAYDSVILQYLQEDDPIRRYELGQQLSTFLSSMRAIQPQIRDVFLFQEDDEDNTFVSLMPNQSLIMQRIQGKRLPVVVGFYPYSTASNESMVLYVGCSIYDTVDVTHLRKSIGCIAVATDLNDLDSTLQELSQIPGIRYALLNEDKMPIRGDINQISENLRVRIQSMCDNHESGTLHYFLQSVTTAPILGHYGSLIIYTQPLVVLSDMFRTAAIVLLLTVVIYLMLSYIFRIVQRSMAQPITHLTRELSLGHTDQDFPIEGNKDVQSLIQTLNDLFRSEKYLSKTLSTANARLREAELAQAKLELQFLRSQINPHFIYNSLEIIRSISLVRKIPEIGEVAKSLAAILRYSIKGPESVPLSEELDIILCYLSIQSIRFGNRFQYTFHVEDAVRGILIPRMCLQPLVENAVTHGLEGKIENGKLIISAIMEESELKISVEDNGVGLSAQRVQEFSNLLQNPDQNKISRNSGLGLINVARRIQIARNNEYGMSIKSEPDVGTVITLKLPVKKGCDSNV